MAEFKTLTKEESLRYLEAARKARYERADLKMMMKAGSRACRGGLLPPGHAADTLETTPR